jgi:hypothetical protein
MNDISFLHSKAAEAEAPFTPISGDKVKAARKLLRKRRIDSPDIEVNKKQKTDV